MDTFFFSSCYEHWWTVILYINNLYFDNTSHVSFHVAGRQGGLPVKHMFLATEGQGC